MKIRTALQQDFISYVDCSTNTRFLFPRQMLQLIALVEDFQVKTLPSVFHGKTTGNYTVLMPNVGKGPRQNANLDCTII